MIRMIIISLSDFPYNHWCDYTGDMIRMIWNHDHNHGPSTIWVFQIHSCKVLMIIFFILTMHNFSIAILSRSIRIHSHPYHPYHPYSYDPFHINDSHYPDPSISGPNPTWDLESQGISIGIPMKKPIKSHEILWKFPGKKFNKYLNDDRYDISI